MELTDSSWRVLGFGYLIFCAVVVAVERHFGASETMSILDRFLVVPAGWGFAVHGIQSGYVRGRFSLVERSESPVTFWINIAFYLLVGLFFFGWGLLGIFGLS